MTGILLIMMLLMRIQGNKLFQSQRHSSSYPMRKLDVSIWEVERAQLVALELPTLAFQEKLQEWPNNHPNEITCASNLQENGVSKSYKRYSTYLGGRMAVRQAFERLGINITDAIEKDVHGAPILPPFNEMIKASISHKDAYVVGLASVCSGYVGVDLERRTNKASTILMRRILSAEEQATCGKLPSISMEEEILLRFSFKEAIFKALHPYLLRPIGFQEVEVYPSSDKSAALKFKLDSDHSCSDMNFKYEATWTRFQDEYWLTCVRLQKVHIENK